MSAQVDNSANVDDDDAAAPVDVDTVKLHNFGLEKTTSNVVKTVKEDVTVYLFSENR